MARSCFIDSLGSFVFEGDTEQCLMLHRTDRNSHHSFHRPFRCPRASPKIDKVIWKEATHTYLQCYLSDEFLDRYSHYLGPSIGSMHHLDTYCLCMSPAVSTIVLHVMAVRASHVTRDQIRGGRPSIPSTAENRQVWINRVLTFLQKAPKQ